ncbi:MAG: Orotate phosphoribosyltransferase [Actinobacteria bacterium]|nr:Orotate phosphoribosyltransferase [Actinomycetota bacterium]
MSRRESGLLFKVWEGLRDLVYPPVCAVCGSPEENFLCTTCMEQLEKIHQPCCLWCGAPASAPVADCYECRNRDFFFEKARAYGLYEGKLGEMIKKFKFKGVRDLHPVLASFIHQTYQEFFGNEKFDFLEFVPLSKKRLRERGFNQSELLAKSLSLRTGILLSGALVKIRETPDQTRVDNHEERQDNVKDAFALKDRGVMRGKSILLIDDVYTTGATVNECAAALKRGGAYRVCVLTLARSVKNGPWEPGRKVGNIEIAGVPFSKI